MNNVSLVGRLVREPEYRENEKGTKVTTITLAINRNYKNSNGEYETDFIRCVLWNMTAEKTHEYCHEGDVVGLKGMLQTRKYTDKEGNTRYVMEVIGEKIIFITSARKKEEKVEVKEETKQEESDPFAEFGQQVEIKDEDLPWES